MVFDYKRLDFYYVDEKYAAFLRNNYDSRVPNIKSPDYRHDKFFIGVVLNVGGELDYFAPVSSYRQKNALTFNIKDGRDIIGSVRPNYMFPIVDGVYKPLQMEKFSKGYRDLVNRQLRFCNKKRAEICGLANNIYSKRVADNFDSLEERRMYYSMYCNYTKLEQGAKEFKRKK